MKKARPFIYGAIAIILVIAGAFTLKRNKEKNQEQTAIVAQTNSAIIVNSAVVKYEHISTDYSSNGTFAPFQELTFPSEISGRIVRVFVDEGSYVRIGQTLATIKKDQLEVDNSTARATYQNAIIDNQRYENAFKTGGVTKQQVDNSRLQLKNSKAQLEQSNIRVGDTNVKATINGVVNKRFIEPGSVVAPGTQMFDIVNVSSLKLKVTVNETQVANLHLGDEIEVKASVFPEETFSGRITFIAPLADASLSFPVEIQIDNNSQNKLRAGMYGTAVFSSKDKGISHAILIVPKEAFVDGVSSGQVFVINKDSSVTLTKVTTGRIFGDQIEIISGLKPDQNVVTTGQINLTNGAKVQVAK
ncbi:efflux RND transporter periplasmic adaptor subunit [Halpernia frigidisoli]|uniref:RND family efflux transporter, MFP subunit n=1 Tax=Halpernia frigidisoli TaxID=1125876 RepID=A0A1I3DJW3_9FLAO|nr:efflux RND transporter periplasmic adaptor subunit [Halpernia frigidisoli]SFH87030.1 RND family efflux transporter, MFP subunit [Halpernia frigidisoli]